MRIVLDGVAGPPDVTRVQEISAKEAGSTTVILIPNCSTSSATDNERPSTANLLAP